MLVCTAACAYDILMKRSNLVVSAASRCSFRLLFPRIDSTKMGAVTSRDKDKSRVLFACFFLTFFYQIKPKCMIFNNFYKLNLLK